VMALVCSGEFRYSELQVALPKITPKMLSRVLKDLTLYVNYSSAIVCALVWVTLGLVGIMQLLRGILEA